MHAHLPDGGLVRLTRDSILNEIGNNQGIISVHEHMGYEELVHDNGYTPVYAQTLEDFNQSVRNEWFQLDGISSCINAVFFPMPLYVQFRQKSTPPAHLGPEGIYFMVNSQLLNECFKWQERYLNSKPLGQADLRLLPIPFMAIDPTIDASQFEQFYVDIFPYICGFKWHPFARSIDLKNYVDAGYLDLAAKYSLPTVIHSARPGTVGNLSDIVKIIGTYADQCGAKVNIAHMGFLHPELPSIKQFKCFFLDISPWHLIYDFRSLGGTYADQSCIDLLAYLLTEYKEKVLFGLDTPWTQSKWVTGDIYGTQVADDINTVKAAIQIVGKEIAQNLLRNNALRFLGATK